MSQLVFTDEDADLLARVRAGDTRAEDAAIRRWEAYAMRVSNAWYHPGGLEWDELNAALRIALLKACRGWRPGRDAVFSTYMHITLNRAASRVVKLYSRRGFTDLGDVDVQVLSLNVKIPQVEDGDIESLDTVPDPLNLEEDVTSSFVRILVKQRVQSLPPPLQETLVLRFGLVDGVERTYREVAALMNVSPMAVGHRIRKACCILRDDPEVKAVWGR